MNNRAFGVLVTRYGVDEGRVNKFQLVEEYLLRSSRFRIGVGWWFEVSLVRVVGDGTKMLFWLDQWLEGGVMCDRYRWLYDLSEN